jgi:hypothetical protein
MQQKTKVDLLLLDSRNIHLCNVIEHTPAIFKKNHNNLFANGLLNFGLTIHKRLKSCYFSHPINVPYMKTTKQKNWFFF